MEWDDLSDALSSKTKMCRSVGLSGENEIVELGNNEIEKKKMARKIMEWFVIVFIS